MRPSALLLMLLLGAACAQQTYSPEAPPVSAPESIPVERLGRLPPQQLRQGECGLFLWARQTGNKLVLFGKSEDDYALMMLDGEERRARRVEASGRDIFGQFTRQSLRAENVDLAIELAFTPEEQSVVGGALIRRATLSLTQRDGWRAVIPVAGLVACR